MDKEKLLIELKTRKHLIETCIYSDDYPSKISDFELYVDMLTDCGVITCEDRENLLRVSNSHQR